MYKVLIVDDEPIIREGLKLLVDWAGLGFEVAGVLPDGQEALDWIEEHTADLLITDVKMPKVTGIELVGRLRKEKPGMRVIVISGFDEFEYVRAMALFGIENYLLKPINEEELAGTLQNIAHKLDHALAEKTKAERNENLIRQNIINRWLYGAIGEHELQERARFLELDLDAVPLRPVLFRFPGNTEKLPAPIRDAIFTDCQKILNALPVCYCAQNYDGETLAVIGHYNQDYDAEILPLIAFCVESVKQKYQILLLVSIGEAVRGYWKLADSFEQARKRSLFLDLSQYMDMNSQMPSPEETAPFSIRLAQYVLEHYNEELSLKQLAQHFKGNAAYIGQTFRKDMGKSFTEYLKAVRLEKAKQLLCTTSLHTTEIALKVGFSNANYFFTIFRKDVGMSPNEYRRTCRN